MSAVLFWPLEVDYDYDGIKKVLTRKLIESRGKTMWRYQELLPIDGEPTVGAQVGFTPLVRANNLAKVLGVKELYVKNDSVNYPTFSFKDRVVSTALTKAKEFGFKTVGCATTGNLGECGCRPGCTGRAGELYHHARLILNKGRSLER